MVISGDAHWTGPDHTQVAWTNPDGSTSSVLAVDPDVAAWLADGNTPADPPAPPEPSLAQRTAELQAGGLAVTSASNNALDGTYPCDPAAQQQVVAEVTSILLNGKFTDGADTLPWLDKNGEPHEFSVDQFKALATAIAKFVTGCARCVSGQSEELPAAEAEIP